MQETGTKSEETTYLKFFIGTSIGKEWYEQNQITQVIPSERPDFLFETVADKRIGLEITKLVIKTDKFRATSALQSIAEQICQHVKKEKGIAISIIIDIYDERVWSIHWSDHLSYAYNPGFKDLDAPEKSIKNAIIQALSSEEITPRRVIKKWVDVGPQKFMVTVSRIHDPHSSAHANNSGMCIEDPFEELQDTITTKNNKFEAYKGNCNECDLLVVFDTDRGNYALFTDKIKDYEFVSSFRNVYLLDLGSRHNVTAIRLKIKPTT